MAAGVQRNQAMPTPCLLVETAIDVPGRVPRSVHQSLFRLAIASVFLPAGLLKLAIGESTIALFQDEYLIVGLATRLATLPLLGQILTIQLFVYPQAWHEHLVWGSILLFLLTRGAGAFSMDHLLGRWFGPSAHGI